MFTPLDGGATLALLMGVATLLAAALVEETRRLFRTYGQLGAIAAEVDGSGAALPVARLAVEVGVREPRVQLLATEQPLACVAGMVRPTLFVSRGMLARLKIVQGGLPPWIYAKLAIWAVMAAMGTLMYRQPVLARWMLVALPLLGMLASWVAVTKPM